MRSTHGFSLIELSIVLVIISLLLGSILVGQDLIHAATIRATVSQVEKFNTAIGVFQKKYGYLPGDMPPETAANLHLFTETGGTKGTAGHGDGNGLLEGCATGSTKGCGETLSFWRQLSDAALIDGNYGTAVSGNSLDVGTGQAASPITAATAASLFPPPRIKNNNFFTTYAAGSFNYYAITGIAAMDTSGTYTLSYAMTPMEAQSIDEKTDDGMPLLGLVTAIDNLGVAAAPGTTGCVLAATSMYNTALPYANQRLCALGLRFQ